jgi:hypothetical protein
MGNSIEYSIFQRFKPANLTRYLGKRPFAGAPEVHYDFYIHTKDHGIPGKLNPVQPDDPINQNVPDLERTVMQYFTGREPHTIFTLDNVIRGKDKFNNTGEGNVRGDMMEHASREIMQAFLEHYSPDNRRRGNFVGISNELKKDHHTIASNNRYELKTKTYPHAILLEKQWNDERTKYHFSRLTDLDGMFSYEFGGNEHTIVVESKVGNWGFTSEKKGKLLSNLFGPLWQLMPGTKLEYVVFSVKDRVYAEHKLTRNQVDSLPEKIQRYIPKNRTVNRLTPEAVDIYDFMKRHNVNVTFFTFNDSEAEIDQASKFLINLNDRYKQAQGRGGDGKRVRGTFIDSIQRCQFYNGAAIPDVEFILNPDTGEYKKITHGWDILSRVTT